jgi:sarcosine oxidase subunit beta
VRGNTDRIVVVGAGIVGASVSYFLARMGARDVTVIEATGVAQGSTGLASGGVRRQFPTPYETELTIRSQELWRAFEHDNDVDLGYQKVGYLLLLNAPESADEVQARRVFQARLGVRIQILERAELARRLPGLTVDDITLAVFTPDDGFASPADVTVATMAAARRLGVVLRTPVTVSTVLTTGNRVVGVRTDHGDVACDVVINAAGLDAPIVGASVGAMMPITPLRQHQFVTNQVDWIPEDMPCTQDDGLNLYMRREGRGLLLGVSSPEDVGSRSREVEWSLAESLAEKVAHRWPRLAQTGLVHAWAGPYEVTPDRRPCIGQLDDPVGFVYAAGFSGHGFMHGFAVGEAVAELVLQGQSLHADLGPFSLARFAHGDAEVLGDGGTHPSSPAG